MNKIRLENQLCFPLYSAARHVVGLYTPHLSDLGLTYTQYLVLMVLWEHDGLSVGEIGERLFLDSGTLTPLLKKLESAGFLDRKRSPQDERFVQIYLTKAGKELEKKAASVPESVGSCLNLAPEEALQLYQLLHKVLGPKAV